jgi:hypothetical protein
MSTTASAPEFPASAFTTDQLNRAWEFNVAEQQSEVESHRKRDGLSEDETQFAVRSYRYTKSGAKVLEREAWVPVVEVPATPEETWRVLGAAIIDMEDAEDDGEDPTALREVALQIAAFGSNFLAVSVERNGYMPHPADLPAYALSAFSRQADVEQARAAVDDAYELLAKGQASISKVRKLEEAEVAAAKSYLDAMVYAIDGATGWRAGSLEVQSPALAELIHTLADQARSALV